jgi:hypothetical protein
VATRSIPGGADRIEGERPVVCAYTLSQHLAEPRSRPVQLFPLHQRLDVAVNNDKGVLATVKPHWIVTPDCCALAQLGCMGYDLIGEAPNLFTGRGTMSEEWTQEKRCRSEPKESRMTRLTSCGS